MIDYSEWPVIDVCDFTHAEFDVTEWDDGTYTLMINYYTVVAKEEGEKNSGMTFCTHLPSDSLEEMHFKISAMIALGFFDGLEIYGSGTIWNSEGDQIREITWNDFVLEDDDEESDDEDDPEDPLHHRSVKTIQ